MNRFVLCAAIAGSVIAMSILFQRPITYNEGLGWDGAQYAQLASQCGREALHALEPFAYRIGMPCLAALVPAPPKLGLWIVNVAASVLLMFLLDAWLRRHLSSTVAVVVLVAFALQWVAPLRQVWWYPTYIDPGALCAIVAALLVVDRSRGDRISGGDKPSGVDKPSDGGKPSGGDKPLGGDRPSGGDKPLGLSFVLFALICFGGALIRETTIIVPVALLFGARVARRDEMGTALTGLVASLAGIGLTHLVATPTSDYWIADAAFYWAYTKPLPTYLLAIFIAYGPALSLIVVGWPAVKAHLAGFPEQAMHMLLVLILAWIGGSDTERFLMWGSPIVLVLIGKAAEQVNWAGAKGAAILLFLCQMVSGRWLLSIPPNFVETPPRAWPILTPWTATSYLQLYSQTPDRLMGAVALLEYFLLCGALVFWFTSTRRSHIRTA